MKNSFIEKRVFVFMSSSSNMGELSNLSIPGEYVSYSFGQQWFGTDNSATKC